MSDPEFITLDDGRLLVSAAFADSLRAQGLDTFDRFMTLPAHTVVRAVPGRSTVRVELAMAGGPATVGYLKRYERGGLSAGRWLFRLLRWPGSDDEAGREWRKILLLRQHGFRTAEPIALGQRRAAGVVIEGFLLQQEVPGGVPADEYLSRNLRTSAPQRRWELIERIGQFAGRFQRAGFIHKDLYLKHVFVVERGADWDLFLIDLQRVLGPRRHRERWYLKDLGALGYSTLFHAKRPRTDLLRLYRGFSGRRRLAEGDKAFLLRIWARVRVFLRRQPKYRRVWNALPP
jgi:hypothetical protein